MSKKGKIISIVLSSVAVLVAVTFCLVYFLKVLPDKKEQEELHRLIQQYYDNKLLMYEEENNQRADYQTDIAFIGDSLTDGYDVASYYSEFVVSNRGIGGDTTFGVENRLKVSLFDLKPKVVVMLIGANNMDRMFENYEQILIKIKENLPNSKVVLLSLTAMSREWGKKNQLACYNNVLIKKYAEKYGFTFVYLYTPLTNLSTGELYEEYTIDGGHFTAKGYEVVTSIVKPVVTELVQSWQI